MLSVTELPANVTLQFNMHIIHAFYQDVPLLTLLSVISTHPVQHAGVTLMRIWLNSHWPQRFRFIAHQQTKPNAHFPNRFLTVWQRDGEAGGSQNESAWALSSYMIWFHPHPALKRWSIPPLLKILQTSFYGLPAFSIRESNIIKNKKWFPG